MKFKTIKLSLKDTYALITLARPNKLNILSTETLDELNRALDEILKHENIRAVILTGENVFTAGADIKEMQTLGVKNAYEFAKRGHALADKIETLPLVVIAAVDGYCIGGGNELISACDYRIASDRAIFSQPEITLGIIPGWGGSQRIPRITGVAKAKELIFTGRMIDAKEAERIGLVNKVVPHDKLLDAAIGFAKEIATKSRVTIAAAKYAVNKVFELPLREGLEFERETWTGLFAGEDPKEGLSAFLEHRKPNYRDKLEVIYKRKEFPWNRKRQKKTDFFSELLIPDTNFLAAISKEIARYNFETREFQKLFRDVATEIILRNINAFGELAEKARSVTAEQYKLVYSMFFPFRKS